MNGSADAGETAVEPAIARAWASGRLADVRLALAGTSADRVWAVGGTLRDLLLERPLDDVDLAVAGDSKAVARTLHGRLGGDVFSLSDRFGTWRVQPAGGGWTVDVTQLRQDSIKGDLALRDFTANAMALPLSGDAPPPLLDPHGGRADVGARVLRVIGEAAYRDDPLRPLRLARLAAVLGFSADAETTRLTRAYAQAVNEASAERIFSELRGLVACGQALRGIELLDELGLTQAVLPELAALRGVDQSAYHHLDAYDHTIDVLRRLIDLTDDPEPMFGDDSAAVRDRLAEPLADGMSRGEALRWGALLHDIAKRETRTEHPDGHIGFPRHDERGARIAKVICRRFNAAERFTQFVSALAREHLRPGYLVRERPLSRYRIYEYLCACEPVEVEVGVLSVADRLATRGRNADAAIAGHLELVRQLNSAALGWRAERSREPLVRGDRLAAELDLRPGPELGELLAQIAEARYAGQIDSADQAIAFARSRTQYR